MNRIKDGLTFGLGLAGAYIVFKFFSFEWWLFCQFLKSRILMTMMGGG